MCELYPEQVRERMLERLRMTTPGLRPDPTWDCRRDHASSAIREVVQVEQEWASQQSKQIYDLSFIADSFHDCTILFTYLDGLFDVWSVGRDPVHIFLLLEAVFKCLDAVARKHKIFKINTISSSFFGAAGLPSPQPDHALRCARFSRDSVGAVRDLLAELTATELGPCDMLQLRVGLHSGRVTAGLLAGDKVRFDVFGDTVNTASRMATSGESGCVHVSPTTAELIIEAGKSNWLVERADMVTLKGKGAMTTYWLRMPSKKDCGQDGSSSSSSSSSSFVFSSPSFLDAGSAPLQSTARRVSFHDNTPMPTASRRVSRRVSESEASLHSLFDHLACLSSDENVVEEEEVVFETDSDVES